MFNCVKNKKKTKTKTKTKTKYIHLQTGYLLNYSI